MGYNPAMDLAGKPWASSGWLLRPDKSSGNAVGCLEESETSVIVPSVVIGEFLVKVPADKHQEVQAVLERRFQIVPYDAIAAACAAKIFQEHKASGAVRGACPATL